MEQYNRHPFLRFFIKSFIIFFWIALFILVLYTPLLKRWMHVQDNVLNIITFSDLIDPKITQEFEKQTGIHVQLSYFENNEELLFKLKSTDAKDYDLILASDYIVQQLLQHQLLKPFDASQLNFLDRINSRLHTKYFDPSNNYAIPYYWAIYGIGVHTSKFPKPIPASWDLIFAPQSSYRITMLTNPRENILITAKYLFDRIDNLTDHDYELIQKTLINQKSWVESYTEYQVSYLLLSHAIAAGIITTPYFLRLKKVDDSFKFIIPAQGTFMIVDSFVLSKHAQEELAYKFLNFLYQPHIIDHHAQLYPFLPATTDIERTLKLLDVDQDVYDAYTNPSTSLEYFRNTIAQPILNKIWITIKTS